jgi:hypothetical protein
VSTTVRFEGFDPIIPNQETVITEPELQALKKQVSSHVPTARGLHSNEPTKRATATLEFVHATLTIAEQYNVPSLKIQAKNVDEKGFEVDIQSSNPSENYGKFLAVVRNHFPRDPQARDSSQNANSNFKFTVSPRYMDRFVAVIHALQDIARI